MGTSAIPTAEEMDALIASIPSVEEMENLGKRPCKYGPRGADGLCPKKPKAPRARKAAPSKSATSARSSSGKPPSASKRKPFGETLAERAVTTAVRKLIPSPAEWQRYQRDVRRYGKEPGLLAAAAAALRGLVGKFGPAVGAAAAWAGGIGVSLALLHWAADKQETDDTTNAQKMAFIEASRVQDELIPKNQALGPDTFRELVTQLTAHYLKQIRETRQLLYRK